MPDPAIVVERVVEWSDTDASGHVHNSIAGRLLEAAESELMRRLDLADLIAHMPRVRMLVEFHAPLYYGQTVRAELRLTEIGRTSLTWDLVVRGLDDVVAITGQAVVVHAPGASAAPWPEALRAKLVAAGT